jgi:uncharacterized membrane protein YqjE
MAVQHSENGAHTGMRRGIDRVSDIGSDVGSLMSDMGVLAQKEMELARAEMGESVGNLTRAVIWGAATVVFAGLMLIFAATTLMLALNEAFSLWLSALITTGVLFVLMSITGLLMRARIGRISVTPQRTINSVREDVEWARHQLNWNER